jgi:hypothetical protein
VDRTLIAAGGLGGDARDAGGPGAVIRSFFRLAAPLLWLIVILSTSSGVDPAAAAQPRGVDRGTGAGVKFRLVASAGFDPESRQAARSDKALASVSVVFRISAHAIGESFYGRVAHTFTNLSPKQVSREVTVWEEGNCHQKRGLPKISVVAIGGLILDGTAQTTVSARMRQVGARLPEDEIVSGLTQLNGVDEIGNFFAYRAATRRSGLVVDQKIYALDCLIKAGKAAN